MFFGLFFKLAKFILHAVKANCLETYVLNILNNPCKIPRHASFSVIDFLIKLKGLLIWERTRLFSNDITNLSGTPISINILNTACQSKLRKTRVKDNETQSMPCTMYRECCNSVYCFRCNNIHYFCATYTELLWSKDCLNSSDASTLISDIVQWYV